LTGTAEQAQSAAMEAITSWDADNETDDALYTKVVEAAARAEILSNALPPSELDAAASSHLPEELLAVLKLEPIIRRCFVLRILVGLSVEACAGLLQLRAHRVNQYTCVGLETLSRQKRAN
jgi:hypothetical protein